MSSTLGAVGANGQQNVDLRLMTIRADHAVISDLQLTSLNGISVDELTSGLVGPAGPTGPAGPAGGLMGFTGPTGRAGTRGFTGHTGFTGCNMVVVPGRNIIILFLTNRQNGGLRELGSYPNLNKLRREIVTTVLKCDNQ